MGGNGALFERVKMEPTIKGMKYASDYQEWRTKNFAHDRDMRNAVKEWEKRTHKRVDDLYYEMQQIRLNEMIDSAEEIDYDKAFDIINKNIPQSDGSGWFRNADSNYKPRIFSYIMDNPQLLNAGWNVAYMHYKWQMEEEGKKPLPFQKWLRTPQTYYRGSTGQKAINKDRWISYSHSKEIANKFAGRNTGAQVSMTRLRPMDTLGSYQDTGEAEIFVPIWKLKK